MAGKPNTRPGKPKRTELGAASAGGSSSVSSPLVLNVANAGSQSGSQFADSSSSLLATWAALTTGVVGVNNNLWGDILIWDLSDLFGGDILVSASPLLALDWATETHPGEAAVLGFGFCAAANLAGAAIQTDSRWLNLYNNGSSQEASLAKRNQATGQTGSTKASPEVARIIPTVLGNKWAYSSNHLSHGDTGTEPATAAQTSTNALTSSNKLFAWMAGGPAMAAVGEVTWKGTLQIYYGGGRS